MLAKDGKAPRRLLHQLPDYQCPFIFSNFNGTSGDVDVLTHEAGQPSRTSSPARPWRCVR